MGPSIGLSCEAGSFSSCCLNPHRCFQSKVLRLYFPTLVPGLQDLSPSLVVPPGLSALECGTTQSAIHRLASNPLHPAVLLRPSYRSGWMFLLYLLGCWTSIQFDFLSVLVLVFVFKFVVVLLLVVQGGTVCLPMPPSWPEVPS